jgi:hypothetical protein
VKKAFIVASTLVAVCATLDAYVLIGPSWPDGSIVMQLQLGSSGGTLIDGSTSWGAAAEAALAAWNLNLNRVQFRVVRDSTAPIADANGVNNVFWSSSVYGSAWPSGTLAVTLEWWRGSTFTDADVVFNNTLSWNSYTGALRPSSSGGTLFDIRRVGLHEFGHALGLDHPDQSGQRVSAIMNSTISNTDQLQADDIAGAAALYGSTSTPTSTAPGAPGSLVATATGATVFLTWSAPTIGGSPTTYYIEAGSVAGAANLANFSTGNVSTSFSAGNVGAGVYYVRVKAANSAGVSGASNEAILIVGGTACTAAPGAPTALIGSTSGRTVTLGWQPSSGNATSYVVEAGSAPGLSNLANSDLGSAAPSLIAPNVGPGVYYVRVRGKNACGVGPASNEIVVIVQ